MRLQKKTYKLLLRAIIGLAVIIGLANVQPAEARDLLVSSFFTDSVLRYDGTTGAFIGVPAGSGGLDGPTFLTSTPTITFLGPTPYLSQADSPFIDDILSGNTFLEDFEDDLLNTPGVIASPPATPIGPGGLTDSVDADDGAIDGFGTQGHSFFSSIFGIVFIFDANVLGSLPTQVGIVWTDGAGTTTFEAFDAVGASLGTIGPVAIADGSVVGTTGEDRFFGVIHPGGISAIEISNTSAAIEVDHLQYGQFAVNNPPVADAGFDQFVEEGELVFLDGTASIDPDGDPLSFEWMQTAGPPVTLSDPTSSTPTFFAPFVDGDTVLTFQLIVSDASLSSTPDTVDVTIFDVTDLQSVVLATPPGDGGLTVRVDAFGSFGSSVGEASSDAIYDPLGPIEPSGTTFESGVAVRVGTVGPRLFLTTGDIGGSGDLPDPGFMAVTPEGCQASPPCTSVTSIFSVPFFNVNVTVTQTVTELFASRSRTGSLLTQTATIVNQGPEPVTFELIRYLDGDLLFDGSIDDGGGRLVVGEQEILFETDAGGDPATSTTFVGITGEGGSAEPPGRFEVDSFSGLRSRIIIGETLDDTVFGDGPDPDEFIDPGSEYDVTLALRNTFVLNPGESTTYTTRTFFGSGAPEAINFPPVADPQAVTTLEDTPKVITLTGIDPEGAPLTFSIVTGPTNGTLSDVTPIDATSAQVTYTPNPNFSGSDSFTFKVNDGELDSNLATVSITVVPNNPPVADPQAVTTPEDTPVAITLTGSDPDGDPLTFAIVTPPAHGSLSGTPPTVTYTPAPNFFGEDSFTFKVNDGQADSNIATVSLTVTPVNDPPIANDQPVTTNEDTPVAITLTGSDPDGDALTFSIVSGPAHGTLSAIGASSCTGGVPNTCSAPVTYTPALNFTGPDSFTFRVNDGKLASPPARVASPPATVSLTVTPVNDPPQFDVPPTPPPGSTFTVLVGLSLTFPVQASDPDGGDPVTLGVSGLPAGASFPIPAPGNPVSSTFAWTPTVGQVGSFEVSFTATDGQGQAAPPHALVINVVAIFLPLERFEGEFPGSFWFVADVTPADGTVFWDDVTCGGPFEGSAHIWSAGIGRAPCTTYANHMDAIMYVEAEYFGLSSDRTDFLSLAVRQEIESPNDFGYLYIQGYSSEDPPHHGERGSPIAEGFCLFNTNPGDCVSVTQIPDYSIFRIRLGPAFDQARFVRVIIGFHADGSGVAGGTFVDQIDFHQSPDHLVFPLPGGFPPVVSVAVEGGGTVRSLPPGIRCPPQCAAAFTKRTPVTLIAIPAPESSFAGWGGACSGSGPCRVVVEGDTSVTATFTLGVDLTGQVEPSSSCSSTSLGLLPFTVLISNIGSAATQGPFTVQVFLSADERLDEGDPALLSKRVARRIPAGGGVTLHGLAPLPSQELGPFLIVALDALNEIQEVNEGNNIVSRLGLCR